MQSTLRVEHEKGNVESLRKWSNELFPVYSSDNVHVMDINRCGLDLFGIVTFGVHLIAYVQTEKGCRYWVPRRSKAQMRYPGMLDNTIGGCLSSDESPIDCIVRACTEKASLPEDYTRTNIKPCGTLSYQMSRTDDGKPGCQHQVQFLYEMELDSTSIPIPPVGEISVMNLMSLDQVQKGIKRGDFEPSCAMTWVALLIRHGLINSENEPGSVEICSRLHRKHDLFIV